MDRKSVELVKAGKSQFFSTLIALNVTVKAHNIIWLGLEKYFRTETCRLAGSSHLICLLIAETERLLSSLTKLQSVNVTRKVTFCI